MLLMYPLAAQEEMLVAAPTMHRLQGRVSLRDIAALSASPDTLDLPFFDDFSKQTYGIPDPAKWVDRTVFINNTYPINQPTMGVATFDITDAQGRVYSQASPSLFAADSLTSKPIRLQPSDAGVYLSFSCQPKGNGDMPERRDSLTLQFFSPSDSLWVSVWSAIADTIAGSFTPNALREKYWLNPIGQREKVVQSARLATSFFKVIVEVGAARFLHPGFRFRFINYATRTGDEVPGKQSNCDMWNVDMVYLNKNRSATDLDVNDVAIQTPVTRLLKDYTSMPWRHLIGSPTAQREQLINSTGGVGVTFSVSNLSKIDNGFRADFEVACVKGAASVVPQKQTGGSHTMQPDTIRSYSLNLAPTAFLNPPQPGVDSVAFDIKVIISDYYDNSRAEYRTNDTAVYRQNFYTYYAYDDGTAENGYGIYGELAARSKLAVKFYSYAKDTLSGVYMYFNNTLDSGNIQPFKLAVWSDNGGTPGNELYVEPNLSSQFDSLNSFAYYKLKYPVVVEGTFYVGWEQQGTAMLNVGFDVNNFPSGKTMVSLDGYSWSLSKMDGQGAIMVRPSFAKVAFDPYTSVDKARKAQYQVAVYPNPVRDELHLNFPDELREKSLRLEIFNLSGQCTLYEDAFVGSTVNVARLQQGTYFIRFSHNGKAVGYARFVKM